MALCLYLFELLEYVLRQKCEQSYFVPNLHTFKVEGLYSVILHSSYLASKSFTSNVVFTSQYSSVERGSCHLCRQISYY